MNLGTRWTKDPIWDKQKQELLLDFEGEAMPEILENSRSTSELVERKGVNQGRKALIATFQGDENASFVLVKPESPIDASGFDNCSLVFDLTSITPEKSAQLYIRLAIEQGHNIRRAAVIPQGQTNAMFFKLSGKYVNMETALRDDPQP